MTSRTPLIRPHSSALQTPLNRLHPSALQTPFIRPQSSALGGRPRRKRYRSAHAFFITLVLFSAFAVFSYLALGSDGLRETTGATLRKRQVTTFASTDEECRLVRHSTDQCAYIAKHCPDEDAGFYTYLSLYYCGLQHFKPLAFIILVAYLGLLFSTIGIAASDFFCINLSTIATILGMSESLAGVTFLAFGNGSPDVFSTFAAFSTDSSSLAIGELFGAACFIAAVVAGAMGVVHPFKVAKKAYIRDISFFMVAAIFSLYCMWDGKLKLWECLTMVGYYIIYVITVVIWHWWFTRRRKQQDRLALARAQYIIHVTDEGENQEYRDDPEEETASRPTLSRGPSSENFSILEIAGDESVDEERDWVMANLPNNMTLNRAPRARRNTQIRPSLVGALEYHALVSTLQKSRSQHIIPMHARGYSVDESNSPYMDSDNLSTTSDPSTRPPYHMSSPTSAHSPLLERPKPEVKITGSGRSRAVSANDAATLRPDPAFIESHAAGKRQFLDVSADTRGRRKSSSSAHTLPLDVIAEAPDLLVFETETIIGTNPWESQAGVQFSSTLLTVPGEEGPGHTTVSPPRSPFSQSPRASPPQRPKLQIPGKSPPGSAPPSPFPEYTDTFPAHISQVPSMYLGPPSASADSQPNLQFVDDSCNGSPLKWWPYSILPPPLELVHRLFPTFQRWHAKSWWERVLAVVAAPSILLLTITLPVIEAEHEEEDAALQAPATATDAFEPYSDEHPVSPSKNGLATGVSLAVPVNPTDGTHSPLDGPGHGSAAVATNMERSHHHPSGPLQDKMHSVTSDPTGPSAWCRWLTITQLFLAPIFIVLVLYTQYLDPPETRGKLINAICIPLLVSFVLLIPLLATTTATYRPKAYEPILALVGFVVAIGWISTIAGQVVAVLKALAVILNMSHAVMGLTIFAVGNSLGDLVADVTVAKLGYPVMALSACFGGPMMNILLGIGMSGSYILVRGAQHRHQKHPGKEIEYRSYNIEVGTTLMISGVTLVFTLLVLLIAVPWNKWIMSKKLGWVLIALWTISTVGNVIVVELYGLGQGEGEALGTIG